MKHLFYVLITFFVSEAGFTQSDRYQKAMEAHVIAIDTTSTPGGWNVLANSFQRIAEAEKNQWLPYYYAALSHTMSGYMSSSTEGASVDKIDPLADKADELLSKAEELNNNESEIFLLRKMIATLKMTADPMSRWQTYGPQAEAALKKAKELNPLNPRVYLMEGQDKFFTPEQFGGSKTEAKKLFDESEQKFLSFKPETALHPKWGMGQLKYFQTLAK